MITRYIIPALAAFGLLMGILFTLTYGQEQTITPNQLSAPPATPYTHTVSGTGIIEANSRNIEIGSFLSGIASRVFVSEGANVKQGYPLFELDSRAAITEVQAREKQVAAAAANVQSAKIALADEQDQLKRVESLKPGLSVTIDQVKRRRFATQRAQSNLALAEAELANSKSQLETAQVNLERMIVYAPMDGRILKIRIQPGEYVSAANAGEGVMLMGNDTPLYLRVTIDENDVWRFDPNAKAIAALRSNKEISVPLSLVRVDPYVQPKRNLTGATSERVDTRVLEVVYRIEATDKPLFIGQQMDVFIEAAQ